METFGALAQGMAVALQPMNLVFALVGVFLGTAVGVLPGIGPALTVALLLPVTYKLDPGGSLIMFAGIYYGGMYGGSTTAILIAIIGFGGGFIPATTVLFAMTAAAFGRRAFLVDVAIGFVLAFVIYLMFDKVLTLSLPAGPLERLL